MTPRNEREPASPGAYFSALGGKLLAGRKEREDAERNQRRLEEAALASRELRFQRIADGEIKGLVARLVYEADVYIAAAREGEGAYYDPLVLEALDNARAAVNAWKKDENEAAAGKFLGIDATPDSSEPGRQAFRAGIVIPGGGGQADGGESRGRILGIVRESLRLFMVQNSIRNAGDADAALTDLAGQEPEKSREEPEE